MCISHFQDRAYELSKLNIKVYNDDLCNEEFIRELFEKYNFTHVAHLAAQAGVRYSLENPQAYIRANVQCQVVLLDILKLYPVCIMWNIVNACAAYFHTVQCIIVISQIHVQTVSLNCIYWLIA